MQSSARSPDERRSSWAFAALGLALVAYVPALLSSPGRMPADTKLYLYLEPGELARRAGSTFEPDQFAGWVPHQQITYLWPSGPWYWWWEIAGIPDWVAHRLWIGSILALAGLGVLRLGRTFGHGVAAATAAATVYQLSPYVLAYISRTSILLLPWAALGWLVHLTVRATTVEPGPVPDERSWRDRLVAWRDPALIAVVVATVGSANPTSILMIVPGPALWLVVGVASGSLPGARAAAVAARTAAACVLTNVWWIAMTVVQGRHGTDVLRFSETLGDVSRTSTATEVIRGLGYWLLYVRDPVAPATTASLDYLVSVRWIAISYAVPLLGLACLALLRWPRRAYAASLVAAGVVLGVGAHATSPLMRIFVGDDQSGLALALRSSTRAVPVHLLGIVLAIAAGVDRVRVGRRQVVAAAAIGLLAAVNLPSLWRTAYVDPAIDRDQDVPDAWTEAARHLTAETPGGARVLQIPGAEFGDFRWGHTVDPPLVGVTDKPIVTRDLLPLGSGPAMDLAYAIDDRFQEGWAEPASIAPVARLLGADTIWVSGDQAYERFDTSHPGVVAELIDGAPGLGPGVPIGEPEVNAADPSTPGAHDATSIAVRAATLPVAPVVLHDVLEPVGVTRTAAAPLVVVAGSGDGLVDAAAAGVIRGDEAILYAADLVTDGEVEHLVITDSNRDRAHHWRSSQDVHGFTETGADDEALLTSTSADQRLDVFSIETDGDDETIAVQEGDLTAIATSYGEPFAYRPEFRAAMAIDGDPATAWRVAEHSDPIGERIELRLGPGTPIRSLRLLQDQRDPGARTIDRVEIVVDGAGHVEIDLDASSLDGGQSVELPAPATSTISIEITGVTEVDGPAGYASVGFAEIDTGRDAVTEVVRTPVDLPAAEAATVVLTRLRVDPANRWRDDPEIELRRAFSTPAPVDVAEVTVRLDRRASDSVVASVLGTSDRPVADRTLQGFPERGGPAALDGDAGTAWTTPYDAAIGATLTISHGGSDGPVTVVQPPGLSTITEIAVTDATGTLDLTLPDPDESGASRVELPRAIVAPFAVTITAIEPTTTRDRRYGDVTTLPAAIAELSAAGIAAVPLDADQVVERECDESLLTVDATPVGLSFTTTVGALLAGDPVPATLCDAVTLPAGTHRIETTTRGSGLQIDRVVLGDPPEPATPVPTASRWTDARNGSATVAACPDGCWFILGFGVNQAWEASVDGISLGDPVAVSGGFNGWYLTPSAAERDVELRWTAQRPATIAITVSAISMLACVAVAALATRGRVGRLASSPQAPAAIRRDLPRWAQVAVFTAAATLLIGPLWGAIATLAAAAARGRSRVVAIGAAALVTACSIAVAVTVWSERPLPDAGWTEATSHLSNPALLGIVCLATAALLDRGDR